MLPAALLPDAVRRAQQGDAAARDRLLAALAPVLRAFFLARLGERPDLDDLVQNTLLRVHGGLNDLREPEKLKGFALKAALFELQDYYRGRYRLRETLYDPDLPPDVSEAASEGADLDVARAYDALSERAREVMELRAYGYRYEEIAGIVGSTEAAIKMQVKRALERLRGTLLPAVLAFLLS